MWVGSPSPGLPSGKLTVCELEHGPVEIVDFPLRVAWWIFPVRYDSHYQRVNLHFLMGVPMVFLYGFLMPSMPVSEFSSPQKKHRLKSSRPSGIHVFGLFFKPKFRGYPHNSYGQTYGCVYVAPCIGSFFIPIDLVCFNVVDFYVESSYQNISTYSSQSEGPGTHPCRPAMGRWFRCGGPVK